MSSTTLSSRSSTSNILDVHTPIDMASVLASGRNNTEVSRLSPTDVRRRVILNLSQVLLQASHERRDLSPIFFEGLYYALDQLLMADNQTDIAMLEEWLLAESNNSDAASIPKFGFSTDAEALSIFTETDDSPVHSSETSALAAEDRRFCERRFGERRIVAGDGQQTTPAAGERRRESERRSGAGRRKSRKKQNTKVTTPTNSVYGAGQGAAVSTLLNSLMFGSQSVPLCSSYFSGMNVNQVADDIPEF